MGGKKQQKAVAICSYLFFYLFVFMCILFLKCKFAKRINRVTGYIS